MVRTGSYAAGLHLRSMARAKRTAEERSALGAGTVSGPRARRPRRGDAVELAEEPDLALVAGLVVEAVEDGVAERPVAILVDDCVELLRGQRLKDRGQAGELVAQGGDHLRQRRPRHY